jgi:hypothetical protein
MLNEITIKFETDRELTEDEISDLIRAVVVQVEEPADCDGSDVEYTTSNITNRFENDSVIVSETYSPVMVQANITTK